MDGFVHGIIIFGTEVPGDHHAGPQGQTVAETHQQENQTAGGSYRGKGSVTQKIAHCPGIKRGIKQLEQIAHMEKLESKKIPAAIDYNEIGNLRDEAREKLAEIRPISLGQAGRISGVSPADISVLAIYLEQLRRREDNQ